MFGLPVHAHAPGFLARALITWLVTAPEEWHLPLTGSAEMAGCIIFRALRDRGLRLFNDEISHVGFIADQWAPPAAR